MMNPERLAVVGPSDHPARRPHPSRLFVEVTTRCNLRCSMCVKQSSGQAMREGHMSGETFARLAPALPHLDALVLNGIGEPLLHPELERFVEVARRAMPEAGWVGFQTNGQLLGPRRAQSLAAAGIDRICISVDATSPEMFEALRGGGRHEAIEIAAASLHHAGRRRGRPIALGVEFVAMRDNLAQLPDLVRWAAREPALVRHRDAHAPVRRRDEERRGVRHEHRSRAPAVPRMEGTRGCGRRRPRPVLRRVHEVPDVAGGRARHRVREGDDRPTRPRRASRR